MGKIYIQIMHAVLMAPLFISSFQLLADESNVSLDSNIDANSYTNKQNSHSTWYIGIGSFTANIASDEPAFDDTNGNGMHVVGGVTLKNRFSIEGSMGAYDFRTTKPTQGVYYPPDDASYSFFSFSLKYNILDINKWRISPWVSLNTATHDIGLSNYVYSLIGDCTSLTAGVDVRLTKRLELRASRNNCTVNATERFFGNNSSKIGSTTYAVNLVYRFGLND